MTALTQQEVLELGAAVAGELERVWPSPHGSVSAVWDVAAAQGWTALGEIGALGGALAALRQLGRRACPFPLMDVYVAARLLEEDGIVDGEVRPLVALDRGVDHVGAVEAADAATHVLLLGSGEARLFGIDAATPTPGLAVPSWSEVRLGIETARVTLDENAVEEAKALLRLGLAVRAMAAAERAHELAVDHAKTRHAFGKPIGAFQAVAHRCANAEIDVVAARRLVEEAVRLHDLDDPAWPLASELAVAYAAAAARRVQLAAHHTLAAIGFFDEHAAPWLFRRVHADVLRIDEFPPAAGEPADVLIERGRSLPRLELGEAAESFRAEVRAFLDGGGDVAASGYLGMAWPPEHGGRDASAEELMVLHEELRYQGVDPKVLAAADLIGNAIVRHGTEEQQRRFLPLIANGELPFYLGYSEPEVGSDLANLRTRAVRDGEAWVIDGQKLWGSGAHLAEYCWLAARTDPEAEPRAGITVFLVRVPCPGWEVQQHVGLSGEISCTTFFDGVRVPDTARIGEVNGGWKVITDALAAERVVMGGVTAHVHRQFDDLLEALRRDPGRAGPRGSAVRARITGLAARLQAARILVNASVGATAGGGGTRREAPMAKIVGSEVYEELCEAALDILGTQAALAGTFELGVRLSIKYVVGGGTNDIQRNLIARGIGLAR
jgi:alkylation response protein AidB-like acyl-CoA dehydrogenase